MAYMAQAIRKGIRKQKFKYAKTDGTAYHWTYIIRAKDPKKRELIAKGMEKAVKCGKLSYSNESKKNADAWDKASKVGFDCSKLKKKGTINCINLVSIACNFAGIKTPRKSSARTAHKKWVAALPDDLECLPYKGTKKLRGDILTASHKPKVHAAGYLGG